MPMGSLSDGLRMQIQIVESVAASKKTPLVPLGHIMMHARLLRIHGTKISFCAPVPNVGYTSSVEKSDFCNRLSNW
jgi:hypothetical protein